MPKGSLNFLKSYKPAESLEEEKAMLDDLNLGTTTTPKVMLPFKSLKLDPSRMDPQDAFKYLEQEVSHFAVVQPAIVVLTFTWLG